MTNTRIGIAVAGAAFYLAAGATAEAAKGVQKVVPANAQRTISGVVLNVTHTNTSGMLHVRTAQHHKKRSVVNPAANVAGGNQQNLSHAFTVTAATRIAHQNGTPLNFAALQRGERVRVQATGQQAVNVQILSHNRMRGSVARQRARTYQPNRMLQAGNIQQPNSLQHAKNVHQPNKQNLPQHQRGRR